MAYKTRTETGSRRGVNGPKRRQWLWEGYTLVGVADTRYLLIDLLGGARRDLRFDLSEPGNRPLTRELIYRLHHTHSTAVANTAPPGSITTQWKAVYQAAEGAAAYRPQCSVYMAGGDCSLRPPLFGFM